MLEVDNPTAENTSWSLLITATISVPKFAMVYYVERVLEGW